MSHARVAVVILSWALVVSCTSAGSLKPGVSRGMLEDGFDKTTEGLSLTVRDRSLEDIRAASERAVAIMQARDRRLRVVSIDKPRTIRLERKDFLGWFQNSYTGIFLKPTDQAVIIEVSKINWSRTQIGEYGASEGEYLRAIQRELGTR